MCFDKKCLFCIPVEIGCLIYGIIMCIKSAIGIIVCIGFLIYFNVFAREQYLPDGFIYNTAAMIDDDYRRQREEAQKKLFFINIGVGIALVYLIKLFIFHVILSNGANKKNAAQVKTYFIYGVTMNVLQCIASIILTLVGVLEFLLIFLICSVFYSLILVMVYQTYTKFNSGHVYAYGVFQDTSQLMNTNTNNY